MDTFSEHLDTALTIADAPTLAQEEMLAAQVSASQYGYQAKLHPDLVKFIQDFDKNDLIYEGM